MMHVTFPLSSWYAVLCEVPILFLPHTFWLRHIEISGFFFPSILFICGLISSFLFSFRNLHSIQNKVTQFVFKGNVAWYKNTTKLNGWKVSEIVLIFSAGEQIQSLTHDRQVMNPQNAPQPMINHFYFSSSVSMISYISKQILCLEVENECLTCLRTRLIHSAKYIC